MKNTMKQAMIKVSDVPEIPGRLFQVMVPLYQIERDRFWQYRVIWWLIVLVWKNKITKTGGIN